MLATLVRDNRNLIRFMLCLRDRACLTLVCHQLAEEETCFAIPRQYLDPIDELAVPPDGALGMWLELLGDFRSIRIREELRIKSVRCRLCPRLAHPPLIPMAAEGNALGMVEFVFKSPFEVIDGFDVDAIALYACFDPRTLRYHWCLYASRGDPFVLDYIDNDSSIQLLIKRRPAFARFFV
jgi:hypothetical protein